MAKGDLNTVNLLLGFWPGQERLDDNYYRYFEWMLQMQQDPEFKPNVDEVFQIAQLCPLTNGNVVYAARNLYNTLTGENFNFDVDCDISGSFASRKAPKSLAIDNSPLNIEVYPNPVTNGIVYIDLPKLTKPNWNITITDVNGKVVTTKNIRNSITKTFVNLNTNNKGLYFVKALEQNSNKMIVKKIIFE